LTQNTAQGTAMYIDVMAV